MATETVNAPSSPTAAPAAAPAVADAPAASVPGTSAAALAAPAGSVSLYVGDLANEVTEAMLYEKFAAVGPLSTIRVCRDAITRRSLGYAYVNFTYPADAQRALDIMNYETIKGRPCRIMWSQRDPSVRRSGLGNVFIKNLDETIDHKALYDTFSAFGNIISCKVSMDQEGKSRGHGFVHYEKQAEADLAIEKVNGMQLVDQVVFVGPWKSKNEMVAHYQAKNANFRNLYVKNIPNGTTEEDFDKLFAEYGEVTSRVLRPGPPVEEGTESTMYGFVCYKLAEEAAKAVEARNGYEMGEPKLALYVARAQKKKERQENIKRQRQQNLLINQNKYKGVNLFIKNLDDMVDDAQLKAAFEAYGSIISAKVMRDAGRNVSRGFGFINFSSHEEATKAVTEMNGNMMDGNSKPLYVAIAQRKEERVHHLAMQRAQLAQNRSAAPYAYQGGMMGFPQQMYAMGQPGGGRGGFAQQAYGGGPRGQPGSGQPGVNSRPPAMIPAMYQQQQQYQAYGAGMNQHQMRMQQQQSAAMYQQQQGQPMGMPMNGGARNMAAGGPGANAQGGRGAGGAGANAAVRGGGAARGGKQGGGAQNNAARQPYGNTGSNAVMRQGVRNAPTNMVAMGGAPMAAGDQAQTQASATPSFVQQLSVASPEEQKQMLGEQLFDRISNHGPLLDQDRAAKITGMLLEMDNTELLHLLEEQAALNAKVAEAQNVLRDAQAATA